MRVVDLTQPWGDRMPTWPQFASIKVTDITTHHRDRKSTMLVETNMHTGTHLDAPSHYAERGRHLGDIPIQDLIGPGVVIDLRPITKPWSYYSLKDVLGCLPKGQQVEEGDVVVLYTGWDQYNWTQPTRDDVMYFDRHPGPQPEVIDYLINDRKIKILGSDLPSIDHSMHVRIRWMRPDLVKECEQMYGKSVDELVPEKDFEYVHYTTARNNVCMVENLGGEIADVAGQRCVIGAFPWRWVGGEACICRVVAFLDLAEPGIQGAEAAGAQPRQWDAGTTPARIMAGGQTKVQY